MPVTTSTHPATLDASHLRAWLGLAADAIHERRELLTRLDAAIGDADHGTNMDRGFGAVRAMLSTHHEEVPGGTLLTVAGSVLMSTVGGASGALWGTAMRWAGSSLGAERQFDAAALAAALHAALEGIVELGAARVGDKTMVDALEPAVAAMQRSIVDGADLETALRSAIRAGDRGMRATVPMRAKKGRASYLGDRSIGHQDPGATSTMIILGALCEATAPGARRSGAQSFNARRVSSAA